jgi:hypothetical protein
MSRIAMLENRISEAEYQEKLKEAEEDLAFIRRVNQAGALQQEDLQRIGDLSLKTFEDEDGTVKGLLTGEEVTMLSIRRGTLTESERSLMQEHVSSTRKILNQVHFPDQYADVPDWASAHHELLNAKGYMKHLAGKEISREVRLLTILDIFEALTAKDRPYKKPMSLEKTWAILDGMVRDGALDAAILDEFRESRAWERIL